MNPTTAMKNLLPIIEEVEDAGDLETGRLHLEYMCTEVIQGRVTDEQAHRWVGYVQGVLVMRGVTTLEVMKNINHEAR